MDDRRYEMNDLCRKLRSSDILVEIVEMKSFAGRRVTHKSRRCLFPFPPEKNASFPAIIVRFHATTAASSPVIASYASHQHEYCIFQRRS